MLQIDLDLALTHSKVSFRTMLFPGGSEICLAPANDRRIYFAAIQQAQANVIVSATVNQVATNSNGIFMPSGQNASPRIVYDIRTSFCMCQQEWRAFNLGGAINICVIEVLADECCFYGRYAGGPLRGQL